MRVHPWRISITKPIDIYHDADKYLKIIAWFSHADLELLGYDKSIMGKRNELQMIWPTASESNPEVLATTIASVIYNSQSGIGRSTRVMGVTYTPPAPTESQDSMSQIEHLICKDMWQNVKLESDAKIHQLLHQEKWFLLFLSIDAHSITMSLYIIYRHIMTKKCQINN